jgi:DNA-binding transcriptional MerR regulator
VADRAYLSIGEVLSLLKDEFPDITISKIRFLESQGLLDPERTPSGYRKFYDADVDRLRWILRQQREHFLPLKVIKGRLGADGGESGEGDAAEGEGEPAVSGAPRPFAGADDDAELRTLHPRVPSSAAAPPPLPAAGAASAPSGPPPMPMPAPAGPVIRRPVLPPAATTSSSPTGASLTLDELAGATSLSHAQVRELEGYGLLTGRPVGGTTYYDEDALVVGRLAAGFLRFGVEARHLRAYKSAAEREAGQFEAIVLPLLKQRNPQSRQQAMETLSELGGLAEGLRSALLRQALRDLTGS